MWGPISKKCWILVPPVSCSVCGQMHWCWFEKKDGGLRFCIELRKRNEWTIKDTYSLPQIDETLDSLQGSQWFSSLDVKSGYWQVEMDEESKPLTAFTVGLLGFYEYERMPFGLTNAPATFQRLMETCLGDLNLHWCIIYLDDIVIFSKDLASHLKRLETIFWKLEEAGLKLKPSKCELFQRQLAYLGHVISAKGVATDEGKIKAIKNWSTPTNVAEVWSFLGFTGYYQRFIPKFMQVARPLHELTLGENVGKEKAAIKWNSRCQQNFDDLKTLCTMAPILAYANFSKPFKLHTDACGTGLGAVLYQTQEDGTEAVIAMPVGAWTRLNPITQLASWSFSPSSGQWSRNSTSTCMGRPSMCILITICSLMYWPQPSWMQPAIAGSPAWQITTSGCSIRQVRPT